MSVAANTFHPDVPIVLLASSSAEDRALARRLLSDLALEIWEAADGGEAFGLLLGPPVDLLVTGLAMTPISGAQLVSAVRLLPQERRPGVIVCSCKDASFDADDSARRQALRDADVAMTRPTISIRLLGEVMTMLQRNRPGTA